MITLPEFFQLDGQISCPERLWLPVLRKEPLVFGALETSVGILDQGLEDDHLNPGW